MTDGVGDGQVQGVVVQGVVVGVAGNGVGRDQTGGEGELGRLCRRPLRLREGMAQQVSLKVDPPFGIRSPDPYRVHGTRSRRAVL